MRLLFLGFCLIVSFGGNVFAGGHQVGEFIDESLFNVNYFI